MTDQVTNIALLPEVASTPDHHSIPSLPGLRSHIFWMISLFVIARSAMLSRLIVQSALHLTLLISVMPSLLEPLSHSSDHQLDQIYQVLE